jgi:hypothetical protein
MESPILPKGFHESKGHSATNNHVVYFIQNVSITVIFEETLDPPRTAITGLLLFSILYLFNFLNNIIQNIFLLENIEQ